MISNELLEKAKKCNSKEENRELSDDELDNVSGGGACFSEDTYELLGITPESPQLPSYHPANVIESGKCFLYQNNGKLLSECCGTCTHSHRDHDNLFCKARSQEFDPMWD